MQERDKEIEDRLDRIESKYESVSNPFSAFLNEDEFSIKIGIGAFITESFEKEDALSKKIQKMCGKLGENTDEEFVLSEIAYRIAIEEKSNDMEKIMRKAIVRMATQPDLTAKILSYRDEQEFNTEKHSKFVGILNKKIEEIGIWEDSEIDDVKSGIIKSFHENLYNIELDDIDESFVSAEIEKFMSEI